jgi:hypothetical protein
MKDPFYTQRLPFAGPSYEGNPILKNSTFLQFHHHKCCTFNPMTRAFENSGSI